MWLCQWWEAGINTNPCLVWLHYGQHAGYPLCRLCYRHEHFAFHLLVKLFLDGLLLGHCYSSRVVYTMWNISIDNLIFDIFLAVAHRWQFHSVSKHFSTISRSRPNCRQNIHVVLYVVVSSLAEQKFVSLWPLVECHPQACDQMAISDTM